MAQPLSPAKPARTQAYMALAIVLGLLCGAYPLPYQSLVTQTVMTVFMNALRLVSLPIIFLAVSTTIMGMQTLGELALLGKRVLRYTLLTTILSASIALVLFVSIAPHMSLQGVQQTPVAQAGGSYMQHLLTIVPSSLFQPFLEGNITAILLMAAAFGTAMLSVENRASVQVPLTAVLAALLKIIRVVTLGVPFVVWAGIVESYTQLQDRQTTQALAGYLGCIVVANLLQAGIVLPVLLRTHGIAPWRAAKVFAPALSMAFFSKSSVATLPVAMRCAEEGQKIDKRISRFCFPLCTSINMNGCAAFILVTVLFVSQAYGRTYTGFELCTWVLLASLSALGNAGVPMGCYVLSCALLSTMNVPLHIMALVLPFYSFIDMLETAVNVWSDACVALCVDATTRMPPHNAA